MTQSPTVLSKTFRKDGFDFTQIKRSRLHALYQKTKGNQPPTYEVVRIKSAPKDYQFPPRTLKDGTTIEGKFIKAGSESYPSNEDWGTYGFSYPSRDQAESKYRDLISKEDQE